MNEKNLSLPETPLVLASGQTMELSFKPGKAQHSSWHKECSNTGLFSETEQAAKS